jgi:hypothetical protein
LEGGTHMANGNHLEMFIRIKKLVETVGIALTAITLLAGAMLVTLSACEQQGPAGKAGDKVDNAVGKVGDSIRDATKPDDN